MTPASGNAADHHAAVPPTPAKPHRQILLTIIVGASFFMHGLDSTIVTTAVPGMAQSFGVNPIRLGIAIVAYLVSMAVFVPVSAWVADRFGARTTMLFAITVFTIGSLLCGISNSVGTLAASRVLQGFGAALLFPVGTMVVLRNLTKSQYVSAFVVMGLFPSTGMMLGPPLGGFITTFFSWRWIFLINIPIGIAGLVMMSIYVENFRKPGRQALDWVGFILTGLTLSTIMYCLEAIGRGTDEVAATSALLAFGIVVGFFAVRHSLHTPNPLLDLSLLRIYTLRKSVTGGSLFRITTGALPFLLPLLFQVVFGMTAFRSGLLTVGTAVGVLAVRFFVERLVKIYGFRAALVASGTVGTIGLILCSLFTPTTPAYLIVALTLVIGFSQGLQYTTLNTLALVDVAQTRMTSATAFSQLFQQLSQSSGVALAACLLHVSMLARGTGQMTKPDFIVAFLGMAVLNILSIWSFWQMPKNVGAEGSGHRAKSPEIMLE